MLPCDRSRDFFLRDRSLAPKPDGIRVPGARDGVIFRLPYDIGHGVRTLLPFVACLMVLLTSCVGMIHAAEAAGSSTKGVALVLHSRGDGDEVAADRDSAVPHHHSICHGHDVATPAVSLAAPLFAARGIQRPFPKTRSLVGAEAAVRLRPPQI